MRRWLGLPLALAAGCGEAPPPQAPVAAPIAPLPLPTAPAAPATKPKPTAPATDLGTDAVRRLLEPKPLPKLPSKDTPPKSPWKSEFDTGELPEKPEVITLPPSPMPESKPPRISPPKERVPLELGPKPMLK